MTGAAPLRSAERGSAGIYVLLLTSFVFFSFMVMAFDLGRLYVVRSELQTAADAAALAAATRLVGTANSTIHGGEQVTAVFDSTTGNDNRFNLRLNQIGVASDLQSELFVDYFSTLLDAQSNVNGGQSGPDARFVRVQVNAEAPTLFTRFLSSTNTNRQLVAAAAIAGISAPICVACGIDALAVAALDTADEVNYGFAPGEYYTLYLTASQQRPNLPACQSQVPQPLDGTAGVVEYIVLNHLGTGPDTGLDGELFRLAAGGLATTPGLDPPGCVTIGAAEAPKPDLQGVTCADSNAVGRDIVCGLNTRFGIDPTTTVCANIEAVSDLALLYRPDVDPGPADGSPQNYPLEYDGNLRRVLTVAIVDAADSLGVLNFRQFLLQNAPDVAGLDPQPVTGAFRAQYIGQPAPLRAGVIGGACQVTAGIGRIVLH